MFYKSAKIGKVEIMLAIQIQHTPTKSKGLFNLPYSWRIACLSKWG